MENNKKQGFATRQIHAGKQKNAAGALCDPIYQTSTFEFNSVEQSAARFSGQEAGYMYTRLNNPSLTVVEEKIASLENAEAALATASGMGAITTAIWSIVESGDEIVADDTLYGCSYSLLAYNLRKLGIKGSIIDFNDIENFKKHLTPKTKIVYFETPCNPTMKLIDIELIAKTAHEYNPEILVVVDNTFSSPYLQRPLDLGADIVVHSATKYINGHGDVIAGFIAGKEEFIGKCRLYGLKEMTGAVLSPFDAFLIARGLKTLDIRMERHCSNARKLVEFFKSHPAVDKIYYPGLEDFPGHEIAKRQMKDFGGMIAIELKGDMASVSKAINKLDLCTLAVSLGDAETLVELPAVTTHSGYTKEELDAAGISEGLVRISVGLEDSEDIIEDFKAALDTLI